MTRAQLDGYLDAVAKLRNPSRRSGRGRRHAGSGESAREVTTRSVSLRRRPPKPNANEET